jgi:hypothetical protein
MRLLPVRFPPALAPSYPPPPPSPPAYVKHEERSGRVRRRGRGGLVQFHRLVAGP